ncbi:hypothetical protein BD779DRAFT_1474826 [Infundibulicybe gibba]|nr:hypothetical protein BD779DRAFT_1474826 [Infundibulicybe gibba]
MESLGYVVRAVICVEEQWAEWRWVVRAAWPVRRGLCAAASVNRTGVTGIDDGPRGERWLVWSRLDGRGVARWVQKSGGAGVSGALWTCLEWGLPLDKRRNGRSSRGSTEGGGLSREGARSEGTLAAKAVSGMVREESEPQTNEYRQ